MDEEVYTITWEGEKFSWFSSVKPENFLLSIQEDDLWGYKLHTDVYLHNPYGPATNSLDNPIGEYWIDGKQVTKEEQEKYLKQMRFQTEFNGLLNSK